MKKLLLLLLVLPFFISCSSVDEEDNKNTKLIISTTRDTKLWNGKLGYYDQDGKCRLLVDVGDLSKEPKEFTIPNEDHDKVYIFGEYATISLKFDTVFSIKSNQVNTIIVLKGTMASDANSNSIYEYPH